MLRFIRVLNWRTEEAYEQRATCRFKVAAYEEQEEAQLEIKLLLIIFQDSLARMRNIVLGMALQGLELESNLEELYSILH